MWYNWCMITYVSLHQLAREFGIDFSFLRKYVLREGFTPVKIRLPEGKSQLMLALTRDDADKLRLLRETQGYTATPRPVASGEGHFYIIPLIPDVLPSRVKLGFTTDITQRLNAHRTACPTAEMLASWPCRVTWEAAAIASITQEGCTLVGNEVFDCDSLDSLVARGAQFFRVMPRLERNSAE